jgi:FkbM family methyltransferase
MLGWGRLKQRIGRVIREAAGGEAVSRRVGEIDVPLAERLAGIEARIDGKLDALARGLANLETVSHGSRATYLGANRVLVKVVLQGAVIAYLVEADDLLLSPWFIVTGGYETDLTNYFLRALKPDSHCIDVGTNFGFFTCLMARFCPQGRVVGVEAGETVFRLCRDNIHINGFGERAEVIHAAANASGADLVLHRRIGRSASTSISKADASYLHSLGEPATEPFTVRGLRIDDLAERLGGRVDFMKIDVEGAEPLVFEGARGVIAGNPQINIVMEWSPGQIRDAGLDVPAFLSSLEAMGLQAFDILPDAVAPLTFEAVSNMPYRAGLLLKRAG